MLAGPAGLQGQATAGMPGGPGGLRVASGISEAERCPCASAYAVICYPLSGQNCFSSWHMDWTEATFLLVWEDFREARKSQHAHRDEESEKEPC